MIKWTRSFLLAAAAVGVMAAPVCATANTWPTQPIRIVVPFQAGDLADTIARTVGQKVGEELGQTVVVENRPGASGLIGLQTALQANADGHTLVLGQMGGMAVAPNINRQPFDVRDEFRAVAGMYSNYMMLAASLSFKPNTLAELIAYAKAQGGKVTMASNGEGGFPHLAFEQIRRQAGGFDYVHVPYKGAAQIPADLFSGRVDVTVLGYSTLMTHVRAGKVKAIAITGTQRNALTPDIATVGETLPGYTALGWFGLFARKGTPEAVVTRLNQAVNKALAMPDIAERARTAGLDLMAGSPDDFQRIWMADHQKWGQLIRDLNLQPR